MDKKIAQNVVLGVFVAIAFVGFIFVLFTIGDGKGLFSANFTLFGKFSDVKGLHYGSEVSLSGLRIGVVKNIKVSETDGDLVVELSLQRKYQVRIRDDSTANIKTQGILGDKYIQISMGSPNLPVLADHAFIPTNEPGDLFSKSGKVVDNISKQFDKGGDMDTLIKNLSKVARNLSELTTQLQNNEMGDKLGKTVSHMEAILRKVEKGEGTLGALINDPTVYEDIKYLMGGAKRSAILKYFMHSFIESGQKAPKQIQPNK